MSVDTNNYMVKMSYELWNDTKRINDKEVFLSSLWLYCGMMNLKGYMPDKVLKVYDPDEKLLATYSEADKQAVFYE